MNVCKNQKPQKFRWKDSKAKMSVRKRRKRISVCKGKPRAGRWCWNRRRRQKGKKQRRFVVHEWRISLSTSWRISFEVSRPRQWNILDPIEAMRQIQTSMNNGRFQILRSRLLEGYKWVKWKTYENPEFYQTWQFLAWSLCKFFSRNRRKPYCTMGRRKCQLQASSAPQQRNLQGIDRWHEITSRWLMTLVWNWKNKLFLLCCALREKTAEVNLRQLQIQLMPVRNSQIQKTLEHAGKWSENMWTTSPIKRYLEVFTVVRVHKPVSIQEAMKMPEDQTSADK